MAFNPPLLTLPKGVTWNYRKSPKFSTISQVPQSGRHPAQATLQDSTIFDIELEWDYLTAYANTTANDFEYLKAFYEAMQGSYGWFLFDPSTPGLETLSVTQDTTKLANGFSGVQNINNYALWSQYLNVSSVWVPSQTVTIVNSVSAPDETPAAWNMSSGPSTTNVFLQQMVSGPQSGWEMTFSVYLKVPAGTASVGIFIGDSAGVTETLCAVTTSWQQFSVTRTVSGTGIYIQIGGNYTITANANLDMAWPHFETGSVANPYYDSQGFAQTQAKAIPATQTFPLWRSSSVQGGGSITYLERIQNISLLAGIYVNGTLQSTASYSQVNLPAQVTFASPPSAGSTICWAGNYNYLVHFSEDTADFEEFLYQLWKMKSMKLETINL